MRRGLLNASQNLFGVFSVKKPLATDHILSSMPLASSKISMTPAKLWTPA